LGPHQKPETTFGASVSFEKPADNSALLMAIDLLLHGKDAVRD
jgi:hypothetical protein